MGYRVFGKDKMKVTTSDQLTLDTNEWIKKVRAAPSDEEALKLGTALIVLYCKAHDEGQRDMLDDLLAFSQFRRVDVPRMVIREDKAR